MAERRTLGDVDESSPLDPFLGPFLERLGAYGEGYTPGTHGRAVAAALGWPPAFADALFTSARARGLVEPQWSRGSRGRHRWQVSRRGATWLAARDAPGAQ